MANQIIKTLGLAVVAGATASGTAYVTSPVAHADTNSDFIKRVQQGVVNSSSRYRLYGSVMMAQAALESGWGQSTLSTDANNYFGVKGTYNGQSVTMRTAEYDANGNLYYVNAQFRKYPSPEQSMDDNGSLLRNGLTWDSAYYSGTWIENAKTYKQAAQALVGKYATDPNYGTKLINMIETYNFNKIVDGDAITSSKTVNYAVTINQKNRYDGLYQDQPWSVYGNKYLGAANKYDGRKVMVTQEVTTSANVTWVGFKLDGHMVYIDKAGVTNQAISNINVRGVIKQDGRNDAFYTGAPWNWLNATWKQTVAKSGLVNKYVVATKQVVSDGTTWYGIDISGTTNWVDARALRVDNTKAIGKDYTATIKQDNRNDGLYANQPWEFGGPSIASMKSMNGKVVRITSEWTTLDGVVWVGFNYNGKNVYMDKRGIQAIAATQTISQNIMLKPANGDAVYSNAPYKFVGETWAAWANNIGLTKHVVTATKQMTGANGTIWYMFTANNKSYWIAANATVKDNSTVNAVNYVAKINQSGRNDTVYQNMPYNYSGAVAKYAANKINGKQILINAERTTPTGTTWVRFMDANGVDFWVDKKAVTGVTGIQATNFTKTFNQNGRSDALYLGAPWNFGNSTWWKTVVQSGMNNKQVQIRAQVKVGNTTWYNAIIGGNSVWFDAAAVK